MAELTAAYLPSTPVPSVRRTDQTEKIKLCSAANSAGFRQVTAKVFGLQGHRAGVTHMREPPCIDPPSWP